MTPVEMEINDLSRTFQRIPNPSGKRVRGTEVMMKSPLRGADQDSRSNGG